MIRWISAFIDVPPDRFEQSVAFWTSVTGTTLSEPRGADEQFHTLERAAGDPHLRMQRLDGPARIHLDLHVDDVAAATARAVDLGAEIVDDRGYVILRSPGGFTFCLVSHDGAADRGPRHPLPVPNRQDIVCIDAPPAQFDIETAFWSALTDTPMHSHPDFPEFAALSLGKRGLPLSLLVQSLGDDDGRHDVHAHLDISAGEGVDAVVATHVEYGALVVHRFDHWTVLEDPAGLEYCVTDRAPD